jgi:hypothetical protein
MNGEIVAAISLAVIVFSIAGFIFQCIEEKNHKHFKRGGEND